MIEQFLALLQQIQFNLPINLYFLALFWIVHIVNFLLFYRLCLLGIIPRNPFGLLGIIFSPFLHGDFNHIFFNSIPLFVLSSLLLLSGADVFVSVTVIIILLSGSLTWLLGRNAIHVGASGLIMGYFSFSLIYAYHAPSMQAVLLGIVAVYYFGGLIAEILPSQENVSWEGHLFGFIAGFSAYYCLPMTLQWMADANISFNAMMMLP